MTKARDVFYIVGKVFAILSIVGAALLIVASFIFFIGGDMAIQLYKNSGASVDGVDEATIKAIMIGIGTGYLIYGLISLVFSILALVFGSKARSKVIAHTDEKKDHILVIVFGVLGGIFYAVAGILGLIARSKEQR